MCVFSYRFSKRSSKIRKCKHTKTGSRQLEASESEKSEPLGIFNFEVCGGQCHKFS